MNTPIAKGVRVRVTTTNGGDVIATLSRNYTPTYPAWVKPDKGEEFVIMANRLKSIEPILKNDPIQQSIHRAQNDLALDLEVTPESLQRAILDGVGEIAGVIVATNEQRHGPFDFYDAKPTPMSDEERERLIADTMRSDPRVTREDAIAALDYASTDVLVVSSEYQIALRSAETGFDQDVLHLSIKRRDREPIRDWRDLQRIKNALVGEECEAIEVFPAESRLVDTANQYHLWAFTNPQVRVPVGFSARLVHEAQVGYSRQRRFTTTDLLWPSKAQLAASLRLLVDWMRDNTGPSDGNMQTVIQAKSLIDQIDRAEAIGKSLRESILPDDLRDQIESVGVANVIAEARRARWISADEERNRERLAELRAIYADDPALESVSDSQLFLAEMRALEQHIGESP